MTILAIFSGRVLARISILLWFKSTLRAFKKHKEPISYLHTSVCTHKQSQILDILGNIEILDRMHLGKMVRIVTLIKACVSNLLILECILTYGHETQNTVYKMVIIKNASTFLKTKVLKHSRYVCVVITVTIFPQHFKGVMNCFLFCTVHLKCYQDFYIKKHNFELISCTVFDPPPLIRTLFE